MTDTPSSSQTTTTNNKEDKSYNPRPSWNDFDYYLRRRAKGYKWKKQNKKQRYCHHCGSDKTYVCKLLYPLWHHMPNDPDQNHWYCNRCYHKYWYYNRRLVKVSEDKVTIV